MHDQSNGSETIHPKTTCVLPLGKPKAILHGFRKTFIATSRISIDSSAQNTHRPVSVFASPRSLYSATDRAGHVSPRNVRGFPYKVMLRSCVGSATRQGPAITGKSSGNYRKCSEIMKNFFSENLRKYSEIVVDGNSIFKAPISQNGSFHD